MMAAENVPCSGGCGKVRSILYGDSPKQWLCYTCAQKKKPATDRARLHDGEWNIAPKVTRDATVCGRCGQIVRCAGGYFKPHSIPGPDNGQTCGGSGKVVGTEGGNASKRVTDRGRLHDALDRVLDGAGRGRDAYPVPKEALKSPAAATKFLEGVVEKMQTWYAKEDDARERYKSASKDQRRSRDLDAKWDAASAKVEEVERDFKTALQTIQKAIPGFVDPT